MPGDGSYARLYLGVVDDEKFDGIADQPCVMGHYTLLLLGAEASWPHAPSIPRWVDQPILDDLVARTIVDLLPGDRYTIRGLTTERERRQQSAVAGGKARAKDAEREGGRFK